MLGQNASIFLKYNKISIKYALCNIIIIFYAINIILYIYKHILCISHFWYCAHINWNDVSADMHLLIWRLCLLELFIRQ